MSASRITTVLVMFTMLANSQSTQAQDDTEIHLPNPVDYCEGETFHAQCAEDEVIIMYSARYGRMKLGKCLSQQTFDLGCNTNILSLMDTLCSGRHECEVRVSSIIDQIPEDKQPCAKDFRSYLEASYTCVQAITKSSDSCITTKQMLVSQSAGYLASIVTDESTCGSIDAPWVLHMKPGQTIDIELYDFAVSTRDSDDFINDVPGVCHVYAIIKEAEGKSSETICGSHVRRSVAYTSSSSLLEVRLVTKRKSAENGYFLLKYTAKGCATPSPPAYGWVQRTGSQAVFGCNGTTDQWMLSCEGDTWQGQPRNCTKDNLERAVIGVFSGSQWASIVIILAIAVTLGLVIFLTGLIILRRRCIVNNNRTYRERPMQPDLYSSSQYRDVNSPYGAKPLSAMDCSNSENDYYRTWQLQRHPPGGRQYPGAGAHGSYNTSVSDDLVEHTHPGMICANPQCGHRPYDSMDTERRQPIEHIYESPKFDRKEVVPAATPTTPKTQTSNSTTTGGTSQQYFELEPEDV